MKKIRKIRILDLWWWEHQPLAAVNKGAEHVHTVQPNHQAPPPSKLNPEVQPFTSRQTSRPLSQAAGESQVSQSKKEAVRGRVGEFITQSVRTRRSQSASRRADWWQSVTRQQSPVVQ